VASLNLEGIASQWWKSYKMRNRIGGWQESQGAVIAKFGATAYPKALRRLMSPNKLKVLLPIFRSLSRPDMVSQFTNHNMMKHIL